MGTSGYKTDNSNNINKGNNKSKNPKRKKSLRENNQDNIQENKINFEDLDRDFKKQFKCNYESNELQDLLSKYIDTINIQDTFFANSSSKDQPFNLLKEKEKNELTQFFESTLPQMKEFLKRKSKLSSKVDYKYNEISSKILELEKASEIFTEKIKNEITRIIKDKSKLEIKYLTIMVLGKCGVGKSTLINNLLQLEGTNKINTGIGEPKTLDMKSYWSYKVPFLRLVDTRGIELNYNFGAKEVQKQAQNYINNQLKTDNTNDFIQCIWYCITGTRMEKVEIELLNSLRKVYGNNQIPIIIIYTQATDDTIVNEMKQYIKNKQIEANFIKVLAERKKLVNNNYLEPFGLDNLVKQTLDSCKKALKGDMRTVMTNKIEKHILNLLLLKNKYISNYIYEESILNFISNYKILKKDDDFINYIIDLFEYNIKYFIDKNMNINSKQYFKNTEFLNIRVKKYFDSVKEKVNEIINPKIKDFSINFLDYQVKIQIQQNKNIKIENKRCLNDFIKTTTNFLNDNYYFLAQLYFINLILTNYGVSLTENFKNNARHIIENQIKTNKIQDLINKCFMIKFDEFEQRINELFRNNLKNNVIIQSYNEYYDYY